MKTTIIWEVNDDRKEKEDEVKRTLWTRKTREEFDEEIEM
jgi:hypothetical protein